MTHHARLSADPTEEIQAAPDGQPASTPVTFPVPVPTDALDGASSRSIVTTTRVTQRQNLQVPEYRRTRRSGELTIDSEFMRSSL